MVVTNSHGPDYLIFQNFIVNRKIFNSYLFFVMFGKLWWISRCVYLFAKLLLNTEETFHNFCELEDLYHSNGRNFSTLST